MNLFSNMFPDDDTKKQTYQVEDPDPYQPEFNEIEPISLNNFPTQSLTTIIQLNKNITPHNTTTTIQ
jgi:hypothetical protein